MGNMPSPALYTALEAEAKVGTSPKHHLRNQNKSCVFQMITFCKYFGGNFLLGRNTPQDKTHHSMAAAPSSFGKFIIELMVHILGRSLNCVR